MGLVNRAWTAWLRCWREDGLRGVWGLFRRACIRGVNLPTIRRLRAMRAEEERRYGPWLKACEPDAAERAAQGARRFSHSLSILIPTWNTRPDLLRALADSLAAQTCPQWEACLWDGHSASPDTLEALRAVAARDPRFRVTFSEENGGISRNTNGALSMARYDWVALCDHDDLLAPDAVYRILEAAEAGADFVYTDEDKCDEAGERFFDPHLKPDFAPDSLRSGNYICHMMAMEKALMERAGAMREAFDGSQDHDLALRATELAEHIVHIPRVLYHWRMVNTSFSHQKIEQCAHVAASAVGDQLRRLGLPGTSDTYLLNCRVDYGDDPDMTVSLILTPAQDGSWRGLGRLLRRTAQPIHEIIAVGHEAPTVRGIPVKTADSLNQAAELASGKALVFVQCGMIPAQRDWLRQLTMFLRRQDVGCAGAPITDRRHCYLHCGYAVDVPGGALSHHLGAFSAGVTYQYNDRVVRNVSGVSSCLMAIRRDVFRRLDGFRVYASDLRGAELGVRAMRAGYLNVITPFALMRAPRGAGCLTAPAPEEDLRRMREALGPVRERYYSPLFEKVKGTMSIDFDRKLSD